MNYRSSSELSKLLSTCLCPVSPLLRPASLHTLCLRTAAIYATTALYEFHDKKSPNGLGNYLFKNLLMFIENYYLVRFYVKSILEDWETEKSESCDFTENLSAEKSKNV